MRTVRPTSPNLNNLVAYDPKYLPAKIYLNANESPYGPPSGAIKQLSDAVTNQMFHRYPDPLAKQLRARIASIHGLDPENILLGNGGDELLLDILLAYGGFGRKLLTAPPSFSSYEIDAKLTGTELVEIPRVIFHDDGAGQAKMGVDESAVIDRLSKGDIDVVMLTSPNNPTGDVLTKDFITSLLNASDSLVLIDQAYIDFSQPKYDATKLLEEHENLVILRTFSKAYALAGIRLGYLLASKQVIEEFCKVRQPYSVDIFSVLAAMAVLDEMAEIEKQVAESIDERERIIKVLDALDGVMVFESQANFILFKAKNAGLIWQRLYDEYGILLRDFSAAEHLVDCLRVSVGTPSENDEFLVALSTILEQEK